MARRPSEQPTDGELEILRILWDTGPSGLGAIHEALQKTRPVAVTTVATVLKLMLDKQLVQRDDGPRGYLWSARTSHKAVASGLVGKLLRHVFDGSAHRLVAHLVEDGALDETERREIAALLQESTDDKQPPRPRGRSKR